MNNTDEIKTNNDSYVNITENMNEEDSMNFIDDYLEDIKSLEENNVNLENQEYTNETILENDNFNLLMKQNDNMIYYEIKNIYKNNKSEYKSKLKLKKDPPIFSISDSEGNNADFKLTELITDKLIDDLQEVKRAYYGFSGPRNSNETKNIGDKIKHYFKDNPLKVIFPIIIVIIGFVISIAQ